MATLSRSTEFGGTESQIPTRFARKLRDEGRAPARSVLFHLVHDWDCNLYGVRAVGRDRERMRGNDEYRATLLRPRQRAGRTHDGAGHAVRMCRRRDRWCFAVARSQGSVVAAGLVAARPSAPA